MENCLVISFLVTPGPSSIEPGKGSSAHAVDQHGDADHEAAHHPRLFETNYLLRKGSVVECRSAYRTEPPRKQPVLRPLHPWDPAR